MLQMQFLNVNEAFNYQERQYRNYTVYAVIELNVNAITTYMSRIDFVRNVKREEKILYMQVVMSSSPVILGIKAQRHPMQAVLSSSLHSRLYLFTFEIVVTAPAAV